MHLLDQRPKPLIIAHRGACAHAPENTLAAFRLAVEHGADGIELDAKLSADGQVMVIHDHSVDRTTGGQGQVRKLSLAQMKALEAGSFFDERFRGEPIPTLDEVFAAVGQHTLINVELTNYVSVGDALPDLVADLVIKHGIQEQVFFSSFHPFNLVRIARRLPGAPLAMLALEGKRGSLARGWIGRWAAPRLKHTWRANTAAGAG
jgi:glycerophosphoryl diester phosphodiesterase